MKKPQDQRERMRWSILITFIVCLLSFASAGIVLVFLTGSIAFLTLCSPLLLLMARSILPDLFSKQKG